MRHILPHSADPTVTPGCVWRPLGNLSVRVGDVTLDGSGRAQAKEAVAYIAPEIILESKASFSADIYSFGVLLW